MVLLVCGLPHRSQLLALRCSVGDAPVTRAFVGVLESWKKAMSFCIIVRAATFLGFGLGSEEDGFFEAGFGLGGRLKKGCAVVSTYRVDGGTS